MKKIKTLHPLFLCRQCTSTCPQNYSKCFTDGLKRSARRTQALSVTETSPTRSSPSRPAPGRDSSSKPITFTSDPIGPPAYPRPPSDSQLSGRLPKRGERESSSGVPGGCGTRRAAGSDPVTGLRGTQPGSGCEDAGGAADPPGEGASAADGHSEADPQHLAEFSLQSGKLHQHPAAAAAASQ